MIETVNQLKKYIGWVLIAGGFLAMVASASTSDECTRFYREAEERSACQSDFVLYYLLWCGLGGIIVGAVLLQFEFERGIMHFRIFRKSYYPRGWRIRWKK